jgi:transcriptional regulator with XRE-family HTH domain
VITSSQIRSARSALGWPASQLGVEAGLSLRTIQTAEADDGENQIRKSSLLAIQAALESAGIEFIGTPDDAPGIRIHKTTQSK